jgi:hypothetical protein
MIQFASCDSNWIMHTKRRVVKSDVDITITEVNRWCVPKTLSTLMG